MGCAVTAFFVGQRVKKVRGHSIGITGVVVAKEPESGYDISIRVDSSCVDDFGCTGPAGAVASCRGDEWEPILPEGHRPAELTVEELLPFLRERAQA